jgi:hypothetical protein
VIEREFYVWYVRHGSSSNSSSSVLLLRARPAGIEMLTLVAARVTDRAVWVDVQLPRGHPAECCGASIQGELRTADLVVLCCGPTGE